MSNFGNLELYSNKATAALKVAGAFGNGPDDTVSVDTSGAGGSTLRVGGTLTNNGVLGVGNSNMTKATNVTAAGLANVGTIELTGSATTAASLDLTGATPATLNGAYTLSGDALLEFASGGITAIGSGRGVTLNGPQALVALKNGLTSNSALTGLTKIVGALDLESGAVLTTTVGLTNLGGLEVDRSSAGGSTLVIGGTLTTENGLYIGNSSLAAATTVSAAALSNFDVVVLLGGNKGAPTLQVAGAFDNARNATVYDDPYGPDGSSVTIGGALTNRGTLQIGNTSQTDATKITAASLANTGSIELTGGMTAPTILNITGAAPATLSGSFYLAGSTVLEFGSAGVTAIGSGASLVLDGNAVVALASAPATDSALTRLGSNAGILALYNAPALTTAVGLDNNELVVDNSGSGGSRLTIGGTLTNEYQVEIGNGSITAPTTVSASALVNLGTLYLNSGKAAATLKVAGAFDNSRNGRVDVDYAYYYGDTGGSSMTIAGTLTNDGTLDIGDGASLTKATSVTAARLANTGTIALAGDGTAAAILDIAGPAPATLEGTYNLSGNALLEFGSGAVTAIDSGASLTLNGAKARVALSSAPTTDSALTGLASNAGTLMVENGASLAATTGLDNTSFLYVVGGSDAAIGGVLSNEGYIAIGGTVSAAALSNFGTIALYNGTATTALNVAGAFANGRNGTLNMEADYYAGGGSRLKVGGKLTNNGALNIGNASLTKATTVTAAGLVNTGTITLTGGATAAATLDITGAAPITLGGKYYLAGDALLEFASGAVTGIGPGAVLSLIGSKAFVALSSSPTSDGALAEFSSNAGTFSLKGAALTTLVGLTNTGTMYVDASGRGDDNLTIGGALTNKAGLYIGNGGLTAATTLSAASLDNSGSFDLTSGTAAAAVAVTGAFNNTDNVYVDTSYGGGSRLTVGGTLTNSGVLEIGNSGLTKATTVTTVGLTNVTNAMIYLTGGTTAAAVLDVASAAPATLTSDYILSGDSMLQFAAGGITAIGQELSLDGATALVAVSGKDTTNSALTRLASNGAALDLANGASLSTTVDFVNGGFLDVDGGYGGGGGGSSFHIGGALTNLESGTVDVGNSSIIKPVTVVTTSITNSGTIDLIGGKAAARLTDTGDFGNTGDVFIDQYDEGGSTLTIGGTLTNNGYFSVAGAATVTAAGLANNGVINLLGGTAAAATLDVAAAAPRILTTELDLAGDALLEFASGGITAIASGPGLVLNGAKSRVALSSAPTTNSALTGLASNAGTLELEGGAAVTTTVSFTNSGITDVYGGSSLSLGGALTNGASADFYITHRAKVTASSLTNRDMSIWPENL